MYAGRKRRKAVQRAVKQAPVEGVKSNPSKRHRDRLNSELDRLSRLLPFSDDITSSLDKLSILRLSVSYLRTKNFFSIALKNHITKTLLPSSNHDDIQTTGLEERRLPEGELLLLALNGFVLVVTSDGIIFYTSQTIQDYLGFQQTDVLHQCVFELIHTEDQQAFRNNLHWALNPPTTEQQHVSDDTHNPDSTVSTSPSVAYKPDQLPPENSSFLERNFICRFRCLLDNSSGFLALNLQGRLKFLHGQNRRLDNGGQAPPQLALFCIATPLQAPSILEIRTKNMIFRTKHKLDFTPLACDAKGKIVLGYTEAELRVRGTGYQFIHAADMLYCAENHVRMIKTGESGLTVFRLLTKENLWKWVQANARLIYKNGRPDYIIATQRPLGEEEGSEHLRKRSIHLPFTFATGEALLYQTSSPVPGFSNSMVTKGKSGKAKKVKGNKVDPSSLLGAMMRQDESVYVCQPAAEPKISYHSSLFSMQDNKGAFFASVEQESWNSLQKGITGSARPEVSTSFDPLLATLDSLSLENEESCSNSELFNALENLRLNAEDLELLLLDERMIRVEIEPEHVPSLNDLLTSDEILSYVHDSLEMQTNNGNCLLPLTVSNSVEPTQGSSEPYVPCTLPASASTTVSGPYLPVEHPKDPSPILQLSQQMQQHLNSQSLQQKFPIWITDSQVCEPPAISFSQHSSVLVNTITGVQHGYCDSRRPSHLPGPNNHQPSWYQLQSEFPSQRQFSSAAQLQQSDYLYHLDQLTSAGCHVGNDLAAGVEFDGSGNEFNGRSAASSSHHQPNYSWVTQNSSEEQIPPFLDIYEMADSAQPHDSTYSKMENDCSTSDEGSCPLLNGNVTTAPSNMPHPPRPDLSNTGFYL